MVKMNSSIYNLAHFEKNEKIKGLIQKFESDFFQ